MTYNPNYIYCYSFSVPNIITVHIKGSTYSTSDQVEKHIKREYSEAKYEIFEVDVKDKALRDIQMWAKTGSSANTPHKNHIQICGMLFNDVKNKCREIANRHPFRRIEQKDILDDISDPEMYDPEHDPEQEIQVSNQRNRRRIIIHEEDEEEQKRPRARQRVDNIPDEKDDFDDVIDDRDIIEPLSKKCIYDYWYIKVRSKDSVHPISEIDEYERQGYQVNTKTLMDIDDDGMMYYKVRWKDSWISLERVGFTPEQLDVIPEDSSDVTMILLQIYP